MAELTNLGITPQIAGEMVKAMVGGVRASAKTGKGLFPIKRVTGRDSAIVIDARGLYRTIHAALEEVSA